MSDTNRDSPWRAEFDDLLRGVAGAFLFGSPFLYTMEVWWKGNIASPARMLFALVATYFAVLVIDRALGFRRNREGTWRRAFADSAEALALGLVTGAASLALLGIIGPSDGFEAVMGRIVMEGIPFSLGVGLANSFMGKGDENGDEGDREEGTDDPKWLNEGWRETLADLGATILGAIVISSSIAPTDEVQVISANLPHPRLLLLVGVSILISYVIVFEADFRSQEARRNQKGFFQTPKSETMISYLASLVVSMVTLWLFQLLSFEDPADKWISYTLVLGLPATIGGAAGRLVI